MSHIQFLVTLTEDGNVQVHRTKGTPDVDAEFMQITVVPDSSLDLHCKVGNFAAMTELARLVRIELRDDTVPKFASPEEADAWMEARRETLV